MCIVWPFAEKDPRDFYERKLQTGQTIFPPPRGLKTRRRREGGLQVRDTFPVNSPETVFQRQTEDFTAVSHLSQLAWFLNAAGTRGSQRFKAAFKLVESFHGSLLRSCPLGRVMWRTFYPNCTIAF